MSIHLRAFALISSFYDKGKDICDAFWPFAIRSIAEDQLNVLQIQKNVEDKYKLQIPIHLLETILKRARKKGFLAKDGEFYSLSAEGIREKNTLELEFDLERRVNELIHDIMSFTESKGIRATEDDIQSNLLDLVYRNLEPIAEFIGKETEMKHIRGDYTGDLESCLIEYIEEASKQRAYFFKILSLIIKGSILSIALGYSHDSTEFNELSKAKFKPTAVFLDSNFLFSLFGFHSEYENRAARELFKLLEKQPFSLRVFDFTVDEITHVVSKYPQESARYLPTIKVDSIYYRLKADGWKDTDAWNFIANIDRKLDNMKISIEYTGIDMKHYEPKDQNIVTYLEDANIHNGTFPLYHDIAVLEKIIEMRKSKKHRIEESTAFLLTSNLKLSRLNYEVMGHKRNGTVCEVILDRLLTHIIWLKSPRAELPISTIIAAYSKSLLIDRSLWEEFYRVLIQLKENETVTEEQIGTLFYHNYVEEVLRNAQETSERITPDFVIDHIEEIGKTIEKEMDDAVDHVKSEDKMFREALDDQMKDRQNLKARQEKIRIIVERRTREIREESHNRAKNLVCRMKLMSQITFLAIAAVLFLSFKGDVAALTICTGFFSVITPFIFGFIKQDRGVWELLKNRIIRGYNQNSPEILSEIEEILNEIEEDNTHTVDKFKQNSTV